MKVSGRAVEPKETVQSVDEIVELNSDAGEAFDCRLGNRWYQWKGPETRNEPQEYHPSLGLTVVEWSSWATSML